MRILHVCLAAFFIDGYAYQENVIPRMHKLAGHNVSILASCEVYIQNKELGYIEPKTYMNEDGIEVTRVPYIFGVPLSVGKKLRLYKGIDSYLEKKNPDLIMLHDVQFLSIKSFAKYKKKHPNVIIVADGHTDYINSARTFISKHILHRLIYKTAIRKMDKYVDKYYGTLPSRVEFFSQMYGIRKEKIDYLPFGVDDTKVKALSHLDERTELEKEYGVPKTDMLIVTGGKFDAAKSNIVELVKAVNEIKGVSLLIFGSMIESIASELEKYRSDKIHYLGWLDETESLKVLTGSDIAFFPYLHSTLWEQTAGVGTPLVVRSLNGFHHIDINGNCLFLESCKEDEIKETIIFCKKHLKKFRDNAERAKTYFTYSTIAERIIRDGVEKVL